MRTTPICIFVFVAAAGCGERDAAPPDSGTDTAAASIGSGETPYMAATDDAVPTDRMPDFGRGVLHLSQRGDSSAGVHEDTVIIRGAPTNEAGIVARWIHRYAPEGVWEYRLATSEQNLVRADMEWLYEENGLPVDTIAGDSSWLRVVYARDASGAARLGWVRITDRMTLETWPDVLMQQNLFFRRPDSLAFFTAPEGERVAIEIQTGDTSDGLDYTMVPLRATGEWMQVEVTSPSDYCAETAGARKDTAWIRYLDARGRPQVWYFTRGC
jgi:hypothetical protein